MTSTPIIVGTRLCTALLLCGVIGTGLLPISLQAQPEQASLPWLGTAPRFQHIDAADGLPASGVWAMYQDRAGLLWIGTAKGLVRSDGIALQEVRPHEDPEAFRVSVRSITEDPNHRIWFGTREDGLFRYDPATEGFMHVTHDPSSEGGLQSNMIEHVHADRSGGVWVITTDGQIHRADAATGAVTHVTSEPTDPTSISHEAMWLHLYVGVPLLEDRNGHVWIGTRVGLNRYDPATGTFVRYTHDPADPTTLCHDFVHTLLEDTHGDLWVGTKDGLCHLDRTTDTFTRYQHDPADPTSLISEIVVGVLQDRTGRLWVSTWEGLDWFDPETETFTHLTPNRVTEGDDFTGWRRALFEDQGGVWILHPFGGGPWGYQYYAHATGTFTRIETDPSDLTSLRFSRNLFHDRMGTVWGYHPRLSKLDRTPRFPLLQHNPADPTGLPSNRIYTLYEAPSEPNVLWVGTGRGLSRLDPAEGTVATYRHDNQDPTSLSDDAINALLEDEAGFLWVASGSGVDRLDRGRKRFTRYPPDPDVMGVVKHEVYALARANEGRMWVGGFSGLRRMDPATGRIDYFTGSYNFEKRRTDSTYHPRLYDAIGQLNPDTRTLAAIRPTTRGVDEEDTASFALATPTTVLVIGMGELPTGEGCRDCGWIEDHTGKRVWDFDRTSSRYAGGESSNRLRIGLLALPPGQYVARYRWNGHHGAGAWFWHAPDHPDWWGLHVLRVSPSEAAVLRPLLDLSDANRPAASMISSLLGDQTGLLWIGTEYGGVNLYEANTDRFSVVLDTDIANGTTDLYEDRDGRIWGADAYNGVYQVDPAQGAVRRVTTDDGLPRGVVNAITEDDAGQLWFATESGLARYDPESGHLRTFDTANGLGALSVWSAARTADGTLYFGSEQGLNVVRPEDLTTDPYPPEAALTSLQVYGEPVSRLEANPLDAAIAYATTATLAHDQNDLTLGFAALHYAQPEKNTVHYRLDGLDTDWIDAEGAREVRYTNLAPGTYTFRVKAANPDGVWSEDERTLAIRIRPPWWRTLPAYLAYGLMLLGGLVAVDRVQRRRVVRRERERAQARELEQAREIERAYTQLQTTQAQLVQQEKLASLGQLTAGIAHEIKNPLNFITNFADVTAEITEDLRHDLAAHPDVLVEVDDLLTDLTKTSAVIGEHGRRADAIVRSMMDHARTSSGERRAVDLNALVAEHVALAYHGRRAQVPDLEVRLTEAYDPRVGEVTVQPQELGRVVVNLVTNALDAVYERARATEGDDEAAAYRPMVHVSTHHHPEAREIRVEDNGAGIPAAARSKIFEPFFTTKPTGAGTGLGLSLSHDIVTQGHGGRLYVDETEAAGAAFVVSLPVA